MMHYNFWVENPETQVSKDIRLAHLHEHEDLHEKGKAFKAHRTNKVESHHRGLTKRHSVIKKRIVKV